MDQSSADRVTRPACKHCGWRVAGRGSGRGLCKRCYATPGVRLLYDVLKPHCNRHGGGLADPEQWPTCAACGGKISGVGRHHAGQRCSTCQRPAALRRGYFARIAAYAARVAAGRPVFDNSGEAAA